MRLLLVLLLLLIPIQASAQFFSVTIILKRSQVTHIDTFRCRNGAVIRKTDYDRDGNGKDDATTYRLMTEEKYFAVLLGDTNGQFTWGMINGKAFNNFEKLSAQFGSVCKAVREKQK